MNVLVVLNSLSPGGTEQSTVLLAARLRRHDITTTIVTLTSAEPNLADEAAAAGLEVIALDASSVFGRLVALRRCIRRRRPDVVHTALFDADQLGRLAAVGSGIPVVSSFVNTPYDPERLADPNVRPWRLQAARLIDRATAALARPRFHAVSSGVKQANARVLRIDPARIVVAERGRDVAALGSPGPERRAEVRRRLGLSADAPVLLSLGRQEHQKAHVDLIGAVELLLDDFPTLAVVIAGREGNATAPLVEALEANDRVRSVVRVLGHRTDVGDLLCCADALVISSRFEGTAGVALEAMAMRTPIVSTSVEGLVGVLEHDRNAVLVEVGSRKGLADGIRTMLNDASLRDRLVAQASDDFEARFTLDAAAERMAALYTELAAK